MQNGDGGCIQCLCICVRMCSCLDAGSPFNINVIDPSKATARGDGLDMVQCNQTTSFFVSAPSAQLNEFDVKIIGNSQQRYLISVSVNFNPNYTVRNRG